MVGCIRRILFFDYRHLRKCDDNVLRMSVEELQKSIGVIIGYAKEFCLRGKMQLSEAAQVYRACQSFTKKEEDDKEERMPNDQALSVLIQTARQGNLRGVFQLQESEELSVNVRMINTFLAENSKEEPAVVAQAPVAQAPVVTPVTPATIGPVTITEAVKII